MVTHQFALEGEVLFVGEEVSLGLPERQLNVWKAMEQRLLGVAYVCMPRRPRIQKFIELEDPEREYTEEENRPKVRWFDPERKRREIYAKKKGHPHDELSTLELNPYLFNGYDMNWRKVGL